MSNVNSTEFLEGLPDNVQVVWIAENMWTEGLLESECRKKGRIIKMPETMTGALFSITLDTLFVHKQESESDL